MLPITIQAYCLRILQTHVSQLNWGTVKLCLPRNTLEAPKLRGSLGLPNFKNYYAVHLEHLLKCNYWASLESTDPFSIIFRKFYGASPQTTGQSQTQSLWDRLKLQYSLHSPQASEPSFLKNLSFYLAWISAAFLDNHKLD